MNEQTVNGQILYGIAKDCLDTCMVESGVNPEVGCASSLNNIHKKAFGTEIGGGASTYLLLQALIESGNFVEIFEPLAGDIIISATGTSTLSTPPYPGHTGIMGNFGIMSNNSFDGLWQEYFTLKSWKERYEVGGGYPTRFFRKK